jgi:hypothetical protein
VLVDKGYIGAGIGIETPVRRPSGGQMLDPDARTRNRLIAGLRGPSERANALLQRWRALERITLCPGASAPSSPPRWYSPQWSEAAGEKTSVSLCQ